MSYAISPYRHSSLLPGPDSIRLLRLGPPENKTAPIKCQLFNYSLDESDKRPPQYEALSYVWGDPEKTLPIFIDEHRFSVTENLHAALWRLQERSIEWIWVDAICINQQDQQERGHQVRSMAKIYGKANRVLVWLGEAADNSDRAFEEIRARKKRLDSADNEMIQQAVLALIQRPWFRRIWILQEVAAARRILIMCGPAEIDGYAFCLGLKSLQVFYKARQDLYNLIRAVTYLIRQANFRPMHGICWSDMSFLAIRPLGDLLDMFHTHEATERNDKVYALLGMSSDALNTVNLLPDYKVSWGEVFQRLIKFLLYKQVSVETWDDREIAVIKSKGFILGQVSSVTPRSGWGDTHNVNITSKNASRYLGCTGEWNARWTLHTSAKSVRQGDLVCLLQGVPKPTIIRICKDYFAVIMIAATPPENVQTESKYIEWSKLLQSVTILPSDLLLIWDWAKSPERPQDQEEYKTLVEADGRVQEHLKTELDYHLEKATRLLNLALILEDLEEYKEAEERLRQVSVKVLGQKHLDILTSMVNLASTCKNQERWKEAEELVVQVMETFKRVLREEDPDTMVSMGNLALTFWNQGRWKEAEVLGVQVMETSLRVLGEEHPGTLISMGNLASTYRNQGRWKEAEELEVQVMETSLRVLREEHLGTLISMGNLALTYRNQGRRKEAEELEVQVMETRKKVLGEEHPDTLTSMANLASTFWNQGRWKEAEELEVQVMETRKRVLGEEHPDTLTSMANLAFTLKSQRRNKEAVLLILNCLQLRKQILGCQLPDRETLLKTLNKWQIKNIEIGL